jgi:MFS superfamily sulfate permease-like transporter
MPRKPAFADVKTSAGRRTSAGINIVGDMSSGFPIPSLPPLSKAGDVIVTAVFVMFIGFIESISVAKTYATLNK